MDQDNPEVTPLVGPGSAAIQPVGLRPPTCTARLRADDPITYLHIDVVTTIALLSALRGAFQSGR